MKITYRISTAMYEYVEIEEEPQLGKTADQVRETYDGFVRAFAPKPINQLPDKEYNIFIDAMLLNEANHIDTWEKLSNKQKEIAQILKRALKRIEARNNRENNN